MKKNIKKIFIEKLPVFYKSILNKILNIPKKECVYFDTKTISDGHHKITYRNIPMIRCPFDYVMYQIIINEIKPDLIIEIGTNFGGTTLYLADIMDKLEHGTIHSIDIVRKTTKVTEQHPRIKLFMDGWEKYDITQTNKFSKILVIEDGSHMYESSLGALNKFSPIVSIGSYYIVEDGIINELGLKREYHGGPIRAINDFLKTNNNFIIDKTYCDMFGKNATFNVMGYLKKTK
ncbi:MAG: CmcI family methyltransferase [bacterium]